MATTFSKAGSEGVHRVRNSRATCTTGSEAATVLDANSGLDLYGITGYVVHADIGAGATAGTLQAYIYNQLSGKWSRAPAYDVTVAAAATSVASFGPAGGLPTFSRGTRLAFLPNALGAIASVIDINGTPVWNMALD